MKSTAKKLSFLFIATLVLNLYGLGALLHEAIHQVQGSLEVSHFHIHKDGTAHSHTHSHDNHNSSESHDHEIQENNILALTSLNHQNKIQKFHKFFYITSSNDFKISIHSISKTKSVFEKPPSYWTNTSRSALPLTTAPPSII